MTIIQAIILGIIQGLTEYLPISSSAHLVLVPTLLRWTIPVEQIFPFNVLVQLGTLTAVIIYFWKDLIGIIVDFLSSIWKRKIFSPQTHLGWMIILATIPGGIAGLFFKDLVEMVFNSPSISAFFLLFTALLLFLAERFYKGGDGIDKKDWRDALWIGLAQALSIFPGISRSGSTISAGMFRRLDRYSATRFSFLMSIPIMLAAGLLSIPDLIQVPDLGKFLPVLSAGFFTAGVIGYLCIHFLLQFVRKSSFLLFSAYCVLFSLFCLIFIYAF